ncbi:RNA ligase 1 family protein [Thiovibrio sp. JS02]
MKKIPTIFIRDPENMKAVLNQPHPDCGWVFAGEGVATRKYDGTCCKIENGKLWKRREIKPGNSAPADFVEEQLDQNTGKCVGWMPVDCNDKQDRYHCEAFSGQPDGTYELLGPKVQGNPEKLGKHILLAHADAEIFNGCPRDMKSLKAWLAGRDIEGVVFHHPDGRMAKIKKRDFGLSR